MKSSKDTPEQIMNNVIESEKYKEEVVKHPEIEGLIKNWKENNKNYTYRDKIRLITKDYSNSSGRSMVREPYIPRVMISSMLFILHHSRR